MAIPRIKAFEEFIAGCRVVTSDPPITSVLLSEAPVDFERRRAFPTLYLAYPDEEMKLPSVLDRIAKELAAGGFDADRDISLAILAMICEIRDPSLNPVDEVNAYLKPGYEAQLDQVAVFAGRPKPGYRIGIGPFELKPFDPRKIKYWAQRIGCDYPVDLDSWRGLGALSRARFALRLIDWSDCKAGLRRLFAKWGEEQATATIIDDYYQAVFRHHGNRIPEMIREHLLVLESGALLAFDESSLLKSPFTNFLGLFHWQKDGVHRGWALLARRGVFHNHSSPDVWSACEEWLKEEFNFDGVIAGRPLGDSLVAYCRFMQKAQRHRWAGRTDEAFLHFVVALDLLLGLDGRSTDAVSNRASVLVHRQLGRSLDEQRTILKRLYNSRSKYVHEGRRPPNGEDEEVEGVSVEVLWALLDASAGGQVKDIEDWISQIDFLASALDAGRQILDSDFRRVGVPVVGKQRTRPNRIRVNVPDVLATGPRYERNWDE